MHFIKILDRSTEIYAAVLRLEPKTSEERRHLKTHGWGDTPEKDYIILMKLNGGVQAEYDAFNWDPHKYGATMRMAHMWLINVFQQNGWEYIVEHIKEVNVQSL